MVAHLDGSLLDPARPLLRADDAGVVRGDGIFEATLAVQGVARDLDQHLQRLTVSAQLLDLEIPGVAAWRLGVGAALAGWTGGDMVLRLFATRGPEGGGPTCWVTGAAVSTVAVRQRTEGVRVLLLDKGLTGPDAAKAPWLLAGAKTLSYAVNMATLRYAAAHGADDVVFVGSDGAILEAPTASVVIARGQELLTPPLEGILDGITVRRLFDAASRAGWQTGYRRMTGVDLTAADGVWLASSVRLLAPVVALDGVPRGDAELTGTLSRLLQVPGA